MGQRLSDVLGAQVRVELKDTLLVVTGSEQPDESANCNEGVFEARLPRHNGWINDDAVKCFHRTYLTRTSDGRIVDRGSDG